VLDARTRQLALVAGFPRAIQASQAVSELLASRRAE
jgi:alkylhydroperoxidase/carboxymuconolactone decarboxylase family protein YurZ